MAKHNFIYLLNTVNPPIGIKNGKAHYPVIPTLSSVINHTGQQD